MESFTYHFFDYKGNIEGYTGQHYDSDYRLYYCIFCFAVGLLLAFLLRKMSREKVKKFIGVTGIVMIALYLVKTLWESHYDVASGDGFNTYLLPFDTCSILMWATLIAGFGKGKFSDWATKWLLTLGFTGGVSNALFLQGLKYYPFWTFGAFYSMIWHFVMVFLPFLMLSTGYVKPKPIDIPRAYGFHLIFSVLPLCINYFVSRMNWMLYDNGGGIPWVEDLCRPYAEAGNYIACTGIVLLAYLGITSALVLVFGVLTFLSDKVGEKIHKKMKSTKKRA